MSVRQDDLTTYSAKGKAEKKKLRGSGGKGESVEGRGNQAEALVIGGKVVGLGKQRRNLWQAH